MNANKLFDLRFVIGIFFLLIGLMILGYSFFSASDAGRSINRWSGLVFALFGGLMVFLSLRKDAADEILEEPGKNIEQGTRNR